MTTFLSGSPIIQNGKLIGAERRRSQARWGDFYNLIEDPTKKATRVTPCGFNYYFLLKGVNVSASSKRGNRTVCRSSGNLSYSLRAAVSRNENALVLCFG